MYYSHCIEKMYFYDNDNRWRPNCRCDFPHELKISFEIYYIYKNVSDNICCQIDLEIFN